MSTACVFQESRSIPYSHINLTVGINVLENLPKLIRCYDANQSGVMRFDGFFFVLPKLESTFSEDEVEEEAKKTKWKRLRRKKGRSERTMII